MRRLILGLCAARRCWRVRLSPRPIPARPIRLVVGYSAGRRQRPDRPHRRRQAAGEARPAGDRRQQAGRPVDRGGRGRRQGAVRRLHAAGGAERADDHQSRGLRQAQLLARARLLAGLAAGRVPAAAGGRRRAAAQDGARAGRVRPRQSEARQLCLERHALPARLGAVQPAHRLEVPAHPLSRQRRCRAGRGRRPGADDHRRLRPDVGPVEGRQAARPRRDGRQAQPGLSRRADHGGGRHPRHGDLAVDRHRGADQHAARDRERCWRRRSVRS